MKDTCSACNKKGPGIRKFTLYTASVSQRSGLDFSSGPQTKTTTSYKGIKTHHYHICQSCIQRSSKMGYVYLGASILLALLLSIIGSATQIIEAEWNEIIFLSICAGPLVLILPVYFLLRMLSPENRLKMKAKKQHFGKGYTEVFTEAEYRSKFG